jgi:hypothetical protein
MTFLAKFDRKNYGGTLALSILYAKIKEGQETKPDNWIRFEIQPAEQNDIYKISYRAYQTPELFWIVYHAAGFRSSDDTIKAGTIIYLPSQAWIRQEFIKRAKERKKMEAKT